MASFQLTFDDLQNLTADVVLNDDSNVPDGFGVIAVNDNGLAIVLGTTAKSAAAGNDPRLDGKWKTIEATDNGIQYQASAGEKLAVSTGQFGLITIILPLTPDNGDTVWIRGDYNLAESVRIDSGNDFGIIRLGDAESYSAFNSWAFGQLFQLTWGPAGDNNLAWRCDSNYNGATADIGDNSTRLATTKHVKNLLSASDFATNDNLGTVAEVASNAAAAAATAQTTATQGVNDASSAQTTADSAATAAAAAQTTATAASNDAATAQSAANSAQSTADSALNVAGDASVIGSAAQSDASTALANAATAQTTADGAQSTADAAAAAAANAQSTANAAEPAITAGTTGDYWRGDKTWVALTKSSVGLSAVENTALSTWAGSGSLTTVGTIVSGTWHGTAIADTYIASAATWNAKESAIAAGTTAQYWRGDKSWVTLDKSAVGLGSVENTAISTWAGSANITTVGTIGTGVWSGTAIVNGKIATALSGKTYDGLTISTTTGTFSLTNAKTFSVTGTLTLSGTDGSTLNIGTGGTLASGAFSAAFDPASPGAIGGTSAAAISGTTFVHGVEDSLTAHAGGTQAAALALSATKDYHRISTCATAGDSISLPAATVGHAHFVRNDGAASCQVFGASTETINGIATATGIALPKGLGAWFVCTTAGAWTTGLGAGPVLVADGTTSACSIARALEVNTGFIFTTNQIQLIGTGTSRLSVNGNGINVDAGNMATTNGKVFARGATGFLGGPDLAGTADQKASIAVANTADSSAIANTTSATAFSVTKSIVTASFIVGKPIRFTAFLKYSTAAIPGALTLKVQLIKTGPTTVEMATSGALVVSGSQTNQGIMISGTIIPRTLGASGTVAALVAFLVSSDSLVVGGDIARVVPSGSDKTVSTTLTQALTIEATWATADASNTILLESLITE